MPYHTDADLPPAVRSKLKGKKRRQWMHVWNSSYAAHGDETRAFAEAWATANKTMPAEFGKANAMSDFQFFMPIAKVEKKSDGTCVVSGYASTPTKDGDNEIVTLDAIQKALPEYMAWGNIREMHQLKAVGKAQEANVDTTGLFLHAKISDPVAVQKCIDKVYQGFSIGGRKLAMKGNKITEIDMTEISVVDRPANPDCKFSLAKSAKTMADADIGYLVKAKPSISAESKALVKMSKIVTSLAKAGPPAAHDGFSLPAIVKANPSPKDDSVEVNKGEACKEHGVVSCEKCALEKREFDQAKRDELAHSGKAMPDGSFPIENLQDLRNAIQAHGRAKDPAKAKAHIKARAKALGATGELPEEWSGKAKKQTKKLAKAKLEAAFGLRNESFLILNKTKTTSSGIAEEAAPVFEKRMNSAGSLAYCFDSIRNAQRSLLMEGKQEGGDGKDKELAKQLGTIAKGLASVIAQKATHEGDEAIDLTDADDQYLSSYLGEDFAMTKVQQVSTGDPLADAVATLMKRAAMPTKAAMVKMAADNVTKSRKACKAARAEIESVHKMLKASYIAKMEKAKKEPKATDDGEFDHAGAMEKLNKAFSKVNEARTMAKAASAQLEKVSRSGQRGQEAADSEGSFYTVPAGVRDLSPDDLATASPGGEGGGSMPPMYPVDGGVYSGKAEGAFDLRKYARNGLVSAEIAELVMKNAKSEGELEALRRIPAMASGGRRPYAFDMTKITAGTGGNGADHGAMNKALFDGVDPNAFASGDEMRHTEASAKVIGNFLTSGQFGKSLFDPSFRGAAGTGK